MLYWEGIIIKKSFVSYITIIFISVILIILSSPSSTQAAGQRGLNKVLSSAADVPTGIKDLNPLFNVPEYVTDGKNYNVGHILDPGEGDNGSKQQVVDITQYGSYSAYGDVWSKRDQADASERNYIDVNKRQTVSMWLFFGGGNNAANNSVADGMSFVLQNVSDTAQNNSNPTVSSTDKTTGIAGETLGVWGAPIIGNSNTSAVLAHRAIQNSWSINFGTYINSSYVNGGTINENFDYAYSRTGNANNRNHIYTGFPANPNSYDTSSSNGPILNESNAIYAASEVGKTAFLSDDAWHHLTVTWIPENSLGNDTSYPEVKFTINDKDPITGTPETGVSRTAPIVESTSTGGINTNPFGFSDPKASNNKLYWGFTGATGVQNQYSANNLVIFESIPSITEGSVTSTVHDNTEKRDVAKSYDNSYTGKITPLTGAEDSVHNKDDLSIKYDLSYDSGSQSWDDIISKIDLPAHITYSTATISYNDSTTPTETIQLSGDQTNITHTLTKALDKTNNTSATIKVNGVANGGDSTSTTVDPAHASFDGSTLYKDINTPSFTITQPKTLLLSQNGEKNQSMNMNGQLNLSGTVSYDPTSTIDTSKITIHRLINGVESPTSDNAPLLSTLDTNNSADIFSYPVKANELKQGSNTVSFYAEDSEYNRSKTITFNITVNGDLIINAAKSSSFQTVQNLPINKTIHRANDWDVDVIDERENGSNWTLQADSTVLTDENNTKETWKDGGLVFVDSKGNHDSITNQTVNIASGTKTTDSAETFHIATGTNGWTKDTGILLDQKDDQTAGTYEGVITWTAVDGLKNIK